MTELESDGVTFVPTWAEENPHLVSDSSTESAAAAADGDDGDDEDVGESEVCLTFHDTSEATN